MTNHEREQFVLSQQKANPFKHETHLWQAQGDADEIEASLKGAKWLEGFIREGHGASEDGKCYVSWVNYCPLTVVAKPEIWGGEYAYRYIVGGHRSGFSNTLAGAIQSAIIGAVCSDRSESDSEYVVGSNVYQMKFLTDHNVDISLKPKRFKDFLIPEFMTPSAPQQDPQDEDVPAAPKM
jgi:hypothetical protein